LIIKFDFFWLFQSIFTQFESLKQKIRLWAIFNNTDLFLYCVFSIFCFQSQLINKIFSILKPPDSSKNVRSTKLRNLHHSLHFGSFDWSWNFGLCWAVDWLRKDRVCFLLFELLIFHILDLGSMNAPIWNSNFIQFACAYLCCFWMERLLWSTGTWGWENLC
jgi:hypothetical protein